MIFKYLDSVMRASSYPFAQSTANIRACAPVGKAEVSTGTSCFNRARERVLLGLTSTWTYGQNDAAGVGLGRGL